MLIDYLPVLIYMIIAVGLVGVIVLLSELLGKKKHSYAKDLPYECGMDPIGDARSRYSVRFYVIAMFFIVFDIEAIFLYPWAWSSSPWGGSASGRCWSSSASWWWAWPTSGARAPWSGSRVGQMHVLDKSPPAPLYKRGELSNKMQVPVF